MEPSVSLRRHCVIDPSYGISQFCRADNVVVSFVNPLCRYQGFLVSIFCTKQRRESNI